MEVDQVPQQPAVDRVDVGILESREQRLTVELDDARAGADLVTHLLSGPDRGDAPVPHRDRPGRCGARHDRLDARAEKGEIGVQRSD